MVESGYAIVILGLAGPSNIGLAPLESPKGPLMEKLGLAPQILGLPFKARKDWDREQVREQPVREGEKIQIDRFGTRTRQRFGNRFGKRVREQSNNPRNMYP